MQQCKIKQLLEEAAKSSDRQRKHQIRVALHNAVYKEDTRGVGIALLLDSLYLQVLQNCPDRLPNFLPLFTLGCGDRDRGVLGDIDWENID